MAELRSVEGKTTAGAVRPELHSHGGLINEVSCSHVNAALQALLHQPYLERFLHNDFKHRNSCRSLLKCMLCPLYAILDSWQRGQVANPNYFVQKWKVVSSELNEEQKEDAYQVFSFFLTMLRLDYLNRFPSFTLDQLRGSFITSPFQLEEVCDVSCAICGVYEKTVDSFSVELPEELSGNLAYDLSQHFSKATRRMCTYCCKLRAVFKRVTLNLPDKLLLHCYQCGPNFNIEFSFNFMEQEFSFSSCFLEPKKVNVKQSLFITFCPDNQLRMFEDCKISRISPGNLLDSKLFQSSRVTFIYTRNLHVTKPSTSGNATLLLGHEEKKLSQNIIPCGPSSPILELEDEFEVLSLDNPDKGFDRKDNISSEEPGNVSLATEDGKKFVHVGVQTDPYPMVSFLTCKSQGKFKLFTGLSLVEFEAVFHLLGSDEVIRHLKLFYSENTPKKAIKSKLSGRDRLFMFLLRLRRGLPLEDLAFIFGVSDSYAGEICYVMTRLMYDVCFPIMRKMFLPAAAQIKAPVMQPFKNLRVILDGASFFIQAPSNFEQQGNTYSAYKSSNVLLFVIGVSCTGDIIFCSEGFEGSMSDKEAVINSGLLQMLDVGDGVMTDRGYELTAELQALGCHFYKPPSLGDRKTFTAEEELMTKALASARIYSEHAIADVKDNRLLQGTIPLTLLPVLPQLVFIAAFLRGFSASRVRTEKVIGVTKDAPQK